MDPKICAKETHDTLVQECVHLQLVSQFRERSSRAKLILARIVFVHFVEHLDSVAEMKMVGSFDDFEPRLLSEPIVKRSNARFEIDQHVVLGGQNERRDIGGEWKLFGIEGLPADEWLRGRRETTDCFDARLECWDLECGPAAEGMTEKTKMVAVETRQRIFEEIAVEQGLDHGMKVMWSLAADSSMGGLASVFIR